MASVKPMCALFARGPRESVSQQFEVLSAYAEQQGLEISSEIIASGKNQSNGISKVIKAVQDPARTWTCLLLVDFSRISRSSADCMYFMHMCDKAGVKVLFANHPDFPATSGVMRDLSMTVLLALEKHRNLSSMGK